MPFAVVVLGCFPPAIRPGAPQSPTPSISIIEDQVAVVLSVNSDYVQSFTILPLKLGSYLHDDPCSRSSTPPCVGSPRAAASPIIDAEVVVLLHGKPERLTSLALSPRCPYRSAARVDDEIAVFLHAEGEPSVGALQHQPVTELVARVQRVVALGIHDFTSQSLIWLRAKMRNAATN